MVSGGDKARKAGWTLSKPAHQPGIGGYQRPRCPSVWGKYTWLVSDSPVCFEPDLSLQFGVRVIASSDRKDWKPWWLWSLINTRQAHGRVWEERPPCRTQTSEWTGRWGAMEGVWKFRAAF